MSGAITSGVSLANITMNAWQVSMNLATGIVEADIGKAVSLDTSASATVKLATAGEEIFGRLEVVEIRLSEGLRVGTVSTKGFLTFPSDPTVPVIGAQIVGGDTAGKVKTAVVPGTPTATEQVAVTRQARVVERNTTLVTVTAMLG